MKEYQVQMHLRKEGLLDIYDPILHTTGRYKDARGYCKQTFNSQMENLLKHEIELNGDEIIDTEKFDLKLFDNAGNMWYHWWLTINPICDHPKQEICGMLVCGICYVEELMADKTKPKKLIPLIPVYSADKHMIVMVKENSKQNPDWSP